jgi:hypothetical protein
MSTRHSVAPALAFAVLAACATVSRQQAPASVSTIQLELAAPPQRVRDQLVSAFAESGLPVATSQPGVVEYHGARERGILGYYAVFARAVIEPVDCTTRVTLFGEETRYDNATITPGRSSTRIGPASEGRAAEVWQKLQRVAQILRQDSGTRAHC